MRLFLLGVATILHCYSLETGGMDVLSWQFLYSAIIFPLILVFVTAMEIK